MDKIEFQYSGEITLNPGVRDTIQIRTLATSLFQLQWMTMVSTAGTFQVRIADDASGQNWQNEMTDVRNIFGTVQDPAILISPMILRANALISIDVQNTSGLAGSIEFNFGGYQIPTLQFPGFAKARPDQWFQYMTRTTLGGGNLDTMRITVQSDSTFQVHKINSISTGDYRLRLIDSASGQAWSDRLIRNGNMAGTAQKPRVMMNPKNVKPNSVIQLEVQNLIGGANTVEVVLEGVKKFILP